MKALDISRNVSLVASAGTGKTFNLALRVIRLLLTENVRPQHILCLTFTRKATKEMFDRIFRIMNGIAARSYDGIEGERDALMLATGFSEAELAERVAKARDRMLSEYSRLRIKTIDSFINMILKQFPFEANLRPDYDLLDDAGKDELRSRAFQETYNALLKEPVWNELLSAYCSLLKISAMRMEDMLRSDTLPFLENNALALTAAVQTAPDASQLLNLVGAALMAEENLLADVAGFAASCHSGKLNIPQGKQIEKCAAAKGAEELLATRIFADNDPYAGVFKNIVYPMEALQYFHRAADSLKAYAAIRSEVVTGISLALAGRYFATLARLKERKNSIDFSDLLSKVYDLLVRRRLTDNADYFYFRLDGKIHHILVDEFQDTSTAQWLILHPMVEESISGIGTHGTPGSFFLVGDPKQTLYRFRGGNMFLIDQIGEKYPQMLREDLQVNFRSARQLVEYVNILFSSITKSLSQFHFVRQQANSTAEGFVQIAEIVPDGKSIKPAQNRFVLDTLKECTGAGFLPGEIAVLLSTNLAVQQMAEYLISEGYEVQTETKRTLAETDPCVVLSSLAAFLESGERHHLSLFALTGQMLQHPSAAAYPDFLQELQEQITARFAELSGASAYTAIMQILADTSFFTRFKDDPNLNGTLQVLADAAFVSQNIRQIRREIARMSISREALSSSSRNAVTLMTIHKSKGLEFPAVILPDLTQTASVSAKHSPFVLTGGETDDYTPVPVFAKQWRTVAPLSVQQAIDEEERMLTLDRLNALYVALTRAKSAMFIAVTPPPKESSSSTRLDSFLRDFAPVPYQEGVLAPPAKRSGDDSERKNILSQLPPEQTIDTPEMPEPARESVHARVYGSFLHTALFLWQWSADSAESAVEQAFCIHGALLDKRDKSNALSTLLRLSEDRFLKETAAFPTLFREKKLHDGDKLLIVDMYAVKEDCVRVVDFKTGEMPETAPEDYVAQVSAYCDLLSKRYSRPAEGYLLWLTPAGCSWQKVC